MKFALHSRHQYELKRNGSGLNGQLTALRLGKFVGFSLSFPLPGFEEPAQGGELVSPLHGRSSGAGADAASTHRAVTRLPRCGQRRPGHVRERTCQVSGA